MRWLSIVAGLVVLVGCTGSRAASPTVSAGTTPTGTASPSASPDASSAAATPSDDTSSPATWASPQPGSTTACESGVGVAISEAGAYQLSGDCHTVTISGDRVQVESSGSIVVLRLRGQPNEVHGQAMASLDVAGDRNDIEAGAVTVVNLAGQENKVTASAIDSVLINGDSNSVDSGTRNGFLSVRGNSNQVEAAAVENRGMVGKGNEVTLK